MKMCEYEFILDPSLAYKTVAEVVDNGNNYWEKCDQTYTGLYIL